MKILLDIDGVLVTAPSWKIPEQLPDGFLKFNDKASRNLAEIIEITKAELILSSTHRIRYSPVEWEQLFYNRGIKTCGISILNDRSILSALPVRAREIEEWVKKQTDKRPFAVIDDDTSIQDLPASIKDRCVLTKPLIGLDEEASEKVLSILGFAAGSRQ